MDPWSPQADPDDPWSPDSPMEHKAVSVATHRRYPVRVEAVSTRSAPRGAVCMVAYTGPWEIARSYVEEDVPRILTARRLFAQPVRVALMATEVGGAMTGRLFALVPFDPMEGDAWRASLEDYDGGPEPLEPDEECMKIPLGRVKRLAHERVFPWDVETEGADMLLTALGEGAAVTAGLERLLDER